MWKVKKFCLLSVICLLECLLIGVFLTNCEVRFSMPLVSRDQLHQPYIYKRHKSLNSFVFILWNWYALHVLSFYKDTVNVTVFQQTLLLPLSLSDFHLDCQHNNNVWEKRVWLLRSILTQYNWHPCNIVPTCSWNEVGHQCPKPSNDRLIVRHITMQVFIMYHFENYFLACNIWRKGRGKQIIKSNYIWLQTRNWTMTTVVV